MRIVLWVAVGFAASCGIGVGLRGEHLLLVSLIACALLAGAALLVMRTKHRLCKVVIAVLVGVLLGSLWYGGYDGLILRPIKAMDGRQIHLEITVTDYSVPTDYGIRADGKIRYEDKTYSVRFYADDTLSLKPGDLVTGVFRLRYTPPGGKQEATSHGGKGIFLLAYPEGDQTVAPSPRIPWKYIPAYIRNEIGAMLERLFAPDAAGFMKALLLGETDGLDYKTNSDLSVSGLRHVAAVSGLHVSILLSVLYLLIGRNRYLTLLLGIPVLLLFAAVAGFSPSVTRACIMQALMLLALVVDREYDPPTALASAALIMLLCNPLVITSVSFQLSVSSIGGIFLFSGRLQAWLLDTKRFGKFQKRRKLHRLLTGVATSISVSLSATVLTVPLSAWYFGTVSLLGLLTNLLCLWVISILFCGGMLTCVLGALWLPAGKILGWLLNWPVRYVLAVAGLVADIPFAAVYTQSPYVVAWLIFCYVLLAVFWLCGRKRPGIFGTCVLLSLCLTLLVSWAEPLSDRYRFTVLDVGQGQCILLQSAGKTYMVDCGGSDSEHAADLAAQTLLSQGITHLDGLILTHLDKDHAAGAHYFLQRIDADLVILPAHTEQEPNAQTWKDMNVVAVDDWMQLTWNEDYIQIFGGIQGKSDNESGLCILFHTEKCDILITGDRDTKGELELLQRFSIPKLDVLVVGHHGSATATSYALLRITQPEVAVISVEKDNAYGLPAQEVLEKLDTYDCRIRRTDLEGTIVIRE